MTTTTSSRPTTPVQLHSASTRTGRALPGRRTPAEVLDQEAATRVQGAGEAVPDVVRRGVGVLAGMVAFGSMCYLAPIEYQAGRWLGLPWWQAWTITATVEGLTLAALLAGQHARGLLPTALALTWVSASVGTLHAAAEEAHRLGRPLDRQAAASALLVCLLMVCAPALMHRLRARVNRAHIRAGHVEREARAAAERERVEREAVERAAEREHAAHVADAARAHERELERSRNYAEAEQARLALERTRIEQEHAERLAQQQAAAEHARARAAAEQAQAERQRADAERVRAEAERQTEQARAQTEQARAVAEQTRAAAERERALAEHRAERERAAAEQARAAAEQERASLRSDRTLARAEWERREEAGRPMTTAEVMDLLEVSPGRARAICAEWRNATAGNIPQP